MGIDPAWYSSASYQIGRFVPVPLAPRSRRLFRRRIMPRYFLHVQDGFDLLEDPDGQLCDNLDARNKKPEPPRAI